MESNKSTGITPLDLSELSRGENVKTKIYVQIGWSRNSQQDWLTLGEVHLTKKSREADIPTWSLQAYLGEHTDQEHDSAYLLSMDLIAVTLNMLCYGETVIHAIIDPNDSRFHVPDENWDYFEGARDCTLPRCKDEPHKLVEYLPPHNQDLYEKLKGKKVTIVTGVKRDE